MKKIFLVLSFYFFSISLFAQVPQGMSYQAVAYDSKGMPIKTPISLKISILDNSDKGAVVYAETHKGVQPDGNGLYSLNIGQGTPEKNKEAAKGESETYIFSKIKWGINSKFIKVEMDSSKEGTGTNYVLVGTNQLMSVPYALYAQSISAVTSADYMNTVNNIQELRNYCFDTDSLSDITVYVKGYSSPSDGGGGVFIYKKKSDMAAPYVYSSLPIPANLYPSDDDGIFVSSNCNEHSQDTLGIWVRQFNDKIDVRFYGASGNSQDDTQKIQKAIDYAAKSINDVNMRPYGYNRTNVVFLPNGSYRVKQLVLKSGVTLEGSSKELTSISPTIDSDNDEPLIVIAKGVVRDVHVSNISFVGYETAKYFKPCFYIDGIRVGDDAAGLWDSSFKNINIIRFKGDSMFFRGGSGTELGNIEYKKVNQFIVFESVYIESVGNIVNPNEHHALSICGINGQFSFNNCRFDGGPHLFGGGERQDQPNYTVSGSNVYIGVVKDEDIAAPSIINFNTCTFQHGVHGFYIESSTEININGCWFENFERAITVKGTYKKSKGINIMNNLFGRAAGRFGDEEIWKNGSGSVIVYSNSQINVLNNLSSNHGVTEKTNFIRLESNPDTGVLYENLGANTFGNSFYDFTENDNDPTYAPYDGDELRYSYGIKKTINVNNVAEVSGSAIHTENAKLIYLLNEKKDVKTIDEIISLVSAGELICIRADQGEIKFTETKNIYLGNMNNPFGLTNGGNLTINNGGFALFVKSDDGAKRETYNLISYKNRE